MNHSATFATAVAGLLLSSCASFDAEPDADFRGRPYAGAGVLLSQLDPDTDEVDGVDVDDDASSGGSVLLGYDIGNRFSVELGYSSLGEATLDPAGSIDYSVYGLSGLVYGFNDASARSRREGFSAFGRLGVGGMRNEASVPYERLDDVHPILGAGVEYGFRNGIGLRGELVGQGTDSRYAQLAILYRFGDMPGRTRRDPPRAVQSRPVGSRPLEPRAVESRPVAPRPVVPRSSTEGSDARTSAGGPDGDSDGVSDAADDCPATSLGQPVGVDGCDLFGGAAEGVSFRSGSAVLNPGAGKALDAVAAALLRYPAIDLSIEAHTDDVGDAEANLDLSRRRAISVTRYLVTRGVPGDRLKPRAYGESRPLAPNTNPAGRTANRRVELRIVE